MKKETQAAFKKLDKDNTRTDMTITVTGEDSQTFSEVIQRDEMIHLSKPLNLTKNLVSVQQNTNRVWLTVETATFTDGKDKWNFSFNGEIFEARILDLDFLQEISGQRVLFGKGTSIECDLQLTEVKEPGKKVKITRVISKVYDVNQGNQVIQQSID